MEKYGFMVNKKEYLPNLDDYKRLTE